jgi:hypothetical protein
MSSSSKVVTGDIPLRDLGIFERALWRSDLHAPFNVISILRLECPPSPEIVQSVLKALQGRHPLMRAGIKNAKFVLLSNPLLPFKTIERPDSFNWLGIVEQEMNTRLDPKNGSFRATYVYDQSKADLFLTFHHSIMDAASAMHLLDELLQMCAAALDSGKIRTPTPLEVAPPVEDRFPPGFQGLTGSAKTINYALGQMADEIHYQRRMRGKRMPSVHIGTQGFPLTLTLSELLVDRLSRRCRAKKVTMNSLLNASIMLSTNRHLYAGNLIPMRTFTFADMRPYTIPPTSSEHLANYISMLRYSMDVSSEMDIWELAGSLHDKIYYSLKQGDKFPASRMSESLIKMFVGLKSMRMGNTALNYSGAVPLKTQYSGIKVKGLHGFLSGFDLGPEASAQARLFNDEIWIDFMFLENDMDREVAGKIVGEVQAILERAGSG